MRQGREDGHQGYGEFGQKTSENPKNELIDGKVIKVDIESTIGKQEVDGDGDGTVRCDVGAFEAPTNTRPTITNPRPAPGSATRDRTPLIAATVRDAQTNLAKPNIKLFVDGNRRDFSYDRSTDRLSFTPGSRLSFGKHTVKVVADDSVLSATKSWSFSVVRG